MVVRHARTIDPGRRQVGLCGERSVHVFAFPALAWALARARPDLNVHVLAENTGSMRAEHLQAMGAALGILDLASRCQVIDTAAWTCMPRRRTLLTTLPPTTGRPMLQRRPEPWDPRWGVAPGRRASAMLRARNRPGEPIRVSTYQYAPTMLFY